MDGKTNTKIITKDKIIKDISQNGRLYNTDTIRMIYDSLENNIKKYLLETSNKQNVKIKLFEGMVLEGKYIPRKTKINNLDFNKIVVSSRIKPKVTITRTYREKLNAKK